MQYPAPLAHALSDFPCRISALLISIVVFIKWHHPLSYFLFSLTATAEKKNPTETIIVLSEYLRKGGNCIDFRVTLKPDYTATITVNPASLISETSRVFVEQQFWQPLGDSNPCQRAENPASWTSRRRGRLMGNWLGNVDSNHDYLIQSQASCLLDDSPPMFRSPLTGRRRNHTSLFLIAQGGQEHFVTPPRL